LANIGAFPKFRYSFELSLGTNKSERVEDTLSCPKMRNTNYLIAIMSFLFFVAVLSNLTATSSRRITFLPRRINALYIQCKKERYVHLRYRQDFHKLLSENEHIKCSQKIPSCALAYPCGSPWRRLYLSGNDQALIMMTEFDFRIFHLLYDCFNCLYENYTPFIKNGFIVTKQNKKKGRLRVLRSFDALGLLLSWTRMRSLNMVLQMIFGMNMTGTPMYLMFCTQLLLHVLRGMDDA